MEISIVKSNKGRDMLVLNGYEFHFTAQSLERREQYWTCAYNSHTAGPVAKCCEVKVVTDYSITTVKAIKGGDHYHDIPCFAKTNRRYNELLRRGKNLYSTYYTSN